MEIKEILYDAIKNYQEHKIISDIAQGDSPQTISILCNECMPILEKMDGKGSEKIISFAEGLVHYLLTIALISSQRKITFSSVDVDVVIPDISTLSSMPENALVIAFPKTNDPIALKKKVAELIKIQPHKENIWFVLEKDLPLEVKTYKIDNSDKEPFTNIINDIIWFTSNRKQSKLKIFRI
ncbi:MAG TPA: hypothetical protein VGR54_07620 [Nitrosopumilaceae archaeon]|nr:hypothetical protein [Nitrosopumilaceae archaeon]